MNGAEIGILLVLAGIGLAGVIFAFIIGLPDNQDDGDCKDGRGRRSNA